MSATTLQLRRPSASAPEPSASRSKKTALERIDEALALGNLGRSLQKLGKRAAALRQAPPR